MRPLHLAVWVAAGACLALLTGCQPVRPTAEMAATPVADTPATVTPVTAPALASAEQALADAVLQFVAAQTGVAPATLRVQTVEALQWPDASLGCPQPDMVYAAVITPGYRVTVAHADAVYIVHTDSRSDGEKVICTQE